MASQPVKAKRGHMSNITKICSVEGCNRPYRGKGFCHMHYLRWWRYGDANYVKRVTRERDRTPRGECVIEGCHNLIYRIKLGLCEKHYGRWRRKGDLNTPIRIIQKSGLNKTKPDIYSIWANIVARTTNTESPNYKEYGAKGVKICKGWRYSVKSFYEDMGNKPSNKHSIDRIKSLGHYSCGHCVECLANSWSLNCRWATALEQTWNRSKSKRNSSGYLGVSLDKRSGKWIAQIRNYRYNYSLGRFDDPEQAAVEYDKAAIFFRGEFAVTNFL